MGKLDTNMEKTTVKDSKDFTLLFSDNSIDVINNYISYSALSSAFQFPPLDETKKKNIYDEKNAS